MRLLFLTWFIHSQCTHMWIDTFGTVGLMVSITHLIFFTRLSFQQPLQIHPDPPVRVSESRNYRHRPSPIVRYPHDPLPSFTLHSPLSLGVLLPQIVSGDPHLFFIAGVYTCFVSHRLCLVALRQVLQGETIRVSTRFSCQPVCFSAKVAH